MCILALLAYTPLVLRRLNRYLFIEIVTYFSLTLLLFTAILFSIRLLHFTSLIVNRGVQLSQVLTVFAALVPAFLEIAVPLAALLGVMMACARLSGDSELIVIRASGVSLFRLLPSVAVFGALTGLFALSVSLYIKPLSFSILQQTLFEIARSRATAGLEPGVFNRLGALTFYAEHVDATTGEFERAMVEDRRTDIRRLAFSASGLIIPQAETRTIGIQLRKGVMHEQQDSDYVLTTFDTTTLSFNSDELLDPSLRSREKNPRELAPAELKQELFNVRKERAEREMQPAPSAAGRQTITDLKKRERRLNVESSLRMSMPIAALLLPLLGLPLGVQPARAQKNWGATVSVILGLIVFVIYYGLLSVGLALNESGSLPAGVAVWMPNLITCAATAFLLWKIASERWSSVGEQIALCGQRSGLRIAQFLRMIVGRVRARA